MCCMSCFDALCLIFLRDLATEGLRGEALEGDLEEVWLLGELEEDEEGTLYLWSGMLSLLRS